MVNIALQFSVKIGVEGAGKQHVEVIRIFPVRFIAHFLLHAIVKLCSRQRIRHRNANVVRAIVSYHFDGRPNVFFRFAQVAELQEISHAGALLLQQFRTVGDLFNRNAFVHGIKDLL